MNITCPPVPRLRPGAAAVAAATGLALAVAASAGAQELPRRPRPSAASAVSVPPAPADVPEIPTVGVSRPEGDALERLRERLAERMKAARAAPGASPYDLRLSARSTAAPAAAAPAKGSAGGTAVPARAQDGPRKTAPPPVAWQYDGPAGPEAWATLSPAYALCGSGQRQSPIDLRGGLAVDLEPVRFDYQAGPFAVVDTGRTVQVELNPGSAVELGGRRYGLQQFHFHRPSEEMIDGRRFEMSLHLVHEDAQGRQLVVALLFDPGPAHPALQQVWNHLPLERHEPNLARVPLALADLLPADRRYYTYMGSHTTPPCTEGVQWVVMRQPLAMSTEQIELFARLYPMNARPLQAAAGRRILQSN